VRAGWNEAAAPELAPLRPGERLRLVLRAAWAAPLLAAMFAVYLILWGLDLGLERIAGRRVTRMGPRVVQAWAALTLPLLGLRYRQRGAPRFRALVSPSDHNARRKSRGRFRGSVDGSRPAQL
jgi:hypothetical protein